jgi:hypothetical protein
MVYYSDWKRHELFRTLLKTLKESIRQAKCILLPPNKLKDNSEKV